MPATPSSREFFILGLTREGQPFRPSDWAERLCGVLSPYRPEGAGGQHAHLGYSPYCRPSVLDGIKCVIVDARLRDLEPMAWDFALEFARDNELQAFEACEYIPPSTGA
jgi:hypothetical protein